MLIKEDFLQRLRDEIKSRFVQSEKLPCREHTLESTAFMDGAMWAHELAVKTYIHNREPLTERQKEYLDLVVCGLTNQEIADRLFVSEKTAKFMMSVLFRRFEVKNRWALTMKVLGVVNENS